MNIFQRVVKAASNMVFPTARLWSLLLPRTKYNYRKDVGTGLDSSVIMAPVLWINRRFQEAPMVILKDEEMIREHQMLTLFRKPNDFYSGRLMRWAIALSYNLDGNAYLVKIRNNQLRPIQLWYIPHWLMEPHWPVDGDIFIDYYQYFPAGQGIKINPSDVIHIRNGIDPRNIRKGYAPIQSLFREIFTDDEAANFTASLVKNYGIPGLIISPGDDSTVMDKDVDAVKEAYKEKFGGDAKGEPLVFRTKTDVKLLSFSPQAMDLGRLRDVPEERVTAILGVSAAVVGFGTGLQQTKVGATMKELRESSYEDCVIPMQNLIAEEFDNKLLNEFETDKNMHIGFDLSKVRVLQEDENKHAERVTKLVGSSLITVGEGRRELGYEVKPEHDVYLRPFNVVAIPIGEIAESRESGGGNGEGKIGDLIQLKFLVPVGLKGEEWQGRLVQALYADLRHLSGIWENELNREFRKLGKTIREAWEQLVEEQGIETLAAYAETKVSIDDIYADLVMGVVVMDEYAKYGSHYLRVVKQTFGTIETLLGLGVGLTDQAELNIVALGGTRRGLLDLSQQTKDGIFKALAEAREAGEGPPQAARRIENQVAAGPWPSSKVRSRVIARTETKYAQNVSSLEVYKAAGFNEVQIVDGQLDTSCDACIARDGEIISVDAAFALDEHPNGTLSWTPIIGGR